MPVRKFKDYKPPLLQGWPELLRGVRVMADLNQGEMAKRLNMSSMTISSWENGEPIARPRQEQLAGLLALSAADIEALNSGQYISGASVQTAEQWAQLELFSTAAFEPLNQGWPQFISGIRELEGLSQRALAKRLRVSGVSITNWEAGRPMLGIAETCLQYALVLSDENVEQLRMGIYPGNPNGLVNHQET